MLKALFRVSATSASARPVLTGRRSERPFTAGPSAAQPVRQDLVAWQEAAARFGHRFGLDQTSSSPPIQRVNNTGEEQGGAPAGSQQSMEIDPSRGSEQSMVTEPQVGTESSMETEIPLTEDLIKTAGRALKDTVKDYKPDPGGKIDTILDVLRLTTDYRRLHENLEGLGEISKEPSGAPDSESKGEGEAPKGLPSKGKKKGKRKAPKGPSDKSTEEEEEDRPETSLQIVKKNTKSPYTHNTALLFKNLAQSYVLGVGAYEPNQKKDHKSVKEYLGSIPSTLRPKVLNMISAPSYREFLNEFPKEEKQGEGEIQSEDPEDKKTTKEQKEQDEIRSKIWSISQLMDLEAARRRAAGVMNALGLKTDLAKGEVTDADVVKRLVNKNAMSHSMASGKSKNPSEGKFQRLQKSNNILLEVMNASGDTNLEKVKKRIALFVDAMNKSASAKEIDEKAADKTEASPHNGPKDNKDEPTIPNSFENAKEAWKEKAGALTKKTMNLHIGSKSGFNDNEDLKTIKATKEYTKLRKGFGKFMRGFYGLPKPDSTDALKEADPHKAERKERALKEAKGTLKDDWFLTWLINKAASEGHQDVLREESDKHTHIDPEHTRHEVEEFHAMFEANSAPEDARKVSHIANLRRGHEMAKDSNVFGTFRMHANNPGQHFHPGFGKYETLQEEVIEPFESLHKSEDEANTRVRGFLDAFTNKDLLSRSKELANNIESYREEYAKKENELWESYGGGIDDEGRKTDKKTVFSRLQEKNPKRGLVSGIKEANERIHEEIRAEFNMISPNEIQVAANKLEASRDVYGRVEPVRDLEAGAVNELVRSFAVKKQGRTRLSLQDLLVEYNIMSPVGVNTDPQKKANQYERAKNDLVFTRKSDDITGKRKFPQDGDEWKTFFLETFTNKKLKTQTQPASMTDPQVADVNSDEEL